jgi:CheY-like chemotaxis protein
MTDCLIWIVDDDADDIYLIEQGFRECSFNVRTFSPSNITELIPALEKTYSKDLPRLYY